MDEQKRNLQGSEKRDIFKRKHKECGGKLYSTDVDFVWVEKSPPGIVAYVDYKGSGESVTFTEAIVYNQWIETTPVYIVKSKNPETGPFEVSAFEGADTKPDPPDTTLRHIITCADWQAFWEWETKLRELYRRKGGKLR
jgi:hypothetical protein